MMVSGGSGEGRGDWAFLYHSGYVWYARAYMGLSRFGVIAVERTIRVSLEV